MALSFHADDPVRPRRDAEVLAAATRVFYERGYADASVQDVADELGILKGSLYHYIRTKEDLLYRVLEQVHREVQQILDEVAAVTDLPPLARVELYVRRQVLYALSNLERNTVYYHDIGHLSEGRRAEIVARRADHSRFIRRLLAEAQARGEIDPELDVSLTSNCIFGTIIWPYRWYRPDGRASRQEIVELCTRFAIGGLLGLTP
jgi:AcrR family transcriptional regulator